MSSASSDSFIISFLSVWIPFISFIVWLLWLGHPMPFLNKSGKSGHPYLISYLRGTGFSFIPLTMILAIHLSHIAFLTLSYVPSLPNFVKNFYHKWKLNFVKSFLCIYWDEQMVFTLYFVNVVCNWFQDIQLSLHLCDKPHLIVAYDPFNVLLNSVCWYFVEDFCIHIYL